jgi:hypothetical protein
MTGHADFTPDEWKLVLQGPPTAGLIVITAQRGGSFRESFSMAKSYTEARKQHGESQLLDEISAAKPETDHTRYHSPEELRQQGLEHIGQAAALVESKGTPQELDEYRRFVVTLADNVANARREGFLGLSGERVSEAEQAAIDDVKRAVGLTA